MKEPLIQFKDYTFQYHSQAKPTLNNVNLDIYPGEKILIVGPSGSGKSTLAHCINGLIPFSFPGESTGKLLIGGKEAKKQDLFTLSQTVGTVLQDPDGQFIGLTVAEDIAFSLENACVPQEEMIDRVRVAAEYVGIENRLEAAPQDLSGGQKQRVSLAGVMVDEIQVILFDEPLANLDPATGTHTVGLIDDIRKNRDTTMIIIEHRLEDVLYREVDRIILMKNGSILADMPPHQLLSTNLLLETGIREPLYLTALKYAGVSVTPDIQPAYIDSLQLTEEDKKSVQTWFSKKVPPQPYKEPTPLLEVNHLDFSYQEGVPILRDISFSITKGEMLAIVGTNGAGKSTLSKVICGFEKEDGGTLFLNGKDLSNQSITQRAKHIGYVMQNPNQMISKTMIFEEVALALKTSNLSPEEITERVEKTLRVCGLYPFRNWPISALSFGQKKRVTIAAVLVQDPEMIILDEPTAGQDFRHYTDIMEFLRELNAQGVTVLMITHDMHLMLEYAPRAMVFSEGRLIADTTGAAVLTNKELAQKASLKETSLHQLATMCHIPEGTEFVQHFIDYDREVRQHEQ